MMISNLLAGGRREREGVSAEMCLSRATVRDCLGRVDFGGGGPPLPSPPPLSCLLYLLTSFDGVKLHTGGKGQLSGPRVWTIANPFVPVIGIPHLDRQQRYLLPMPLHSVVDPALHTPHLFHAPRPIHIWISPILYYWKNRGVKKG